MPLDALREALEEPLAALVRAVLVQQRQAIRVVVCRGEARLPQHALVPAVAVEQPVELRAITLRVELRAQEGGDHLVLVDRLQDPHRFEPTQAAIASAP